MTATDPDPRQQLAELEARILDGDDTVTPAALQKARAAADLAELQSAAAARRSAEQAAASRAETEAAYRVELDAQLAQLASVQTAYAAAVDALRTLNGHVDAWQQRRFDLARRGKTLGLADEADILPDLSRRDWVAAANDEAHGKYDRHHVSNRRHGDVLYAAVRFHVLHDSATRERIEREDEARVAARAAARAQRESERVRPTPSFRSDAARGDVPPSPRPGDRRSA